MTIVTGNEQKDDYSHGNDQRDDVPAINPLAAVDHIL